MRSASGRVTDQSREFSVERWHRLPFTPAEIAADGAIPSLRLAE